MQYDFTSLSVMYTSCCGEIVSVRLCVSILKHAHTVVTHLTHMLSVCFVLGNIWNSYITSTAHAITPIYNTQR
jgi:hypothetical protein